jgi:hypothetical protein
MQAHVKPEQRQSLCQDTITVPDESGLSPGKSKVKPGFHSIPADPRHPIAVLAVPVWLKSHFS